MKNKTFYYIYIYLNYFYFTQTFNYNKNSHPKIRKPFIFNRKSTQSLPVRNFIRLFSSIEPKLSKSFKKSLTKTQHSKIKENLDFLLKEQENEESEPTKIERKELKSVRLPISMFNEGQFCNGRILKIKPFGLWIDIGCNQNGFLHIKDISDNWIDDITKIYSIGEKITVKIKYIDFNKSIIALTKLDKNHYEYNKKKRFKSY